jgi:sec-independent protein translocase protein TatA
MGLSGVSIGQLLLVLVIVLLIFGGKRLSSLGSDVGNALKSFRKAMGEEEEKKESPTDKISDKNDKTDKEL